MIKCQEFYHLLVKNKIKFFTGVPDTILQGFCDCLMDNAHDQPNVIAANEGNAVALAAGYHLATHGMGLVYMQNSGLGNATNPLVSLVNSEAFGIPLLLVIGWRGEPGFKDEPQHIKQGKITLGMLKILNIPFEILPAHLDGASTALKRAVDFMTCKNAPFALVVRNKTFEPYKPKTKVRAAYHLTREEAIRLVLNRLGPQDVIIATTGKTSRELFEFRENQGQGHVQDFLSVGSMGHASQIALAVALSRPEREVYCLDGDGSLLMHMGGLALIGSKSPKNFKHIVLNNGSHDSVGGQPTAGFDIDIRRIAQSCGYKTAFRTSTQKGVKKMCDLLKAAEGPALLEIRIKRGTRKGLGRPTFTPQENKTFFMNFLENPLT